MNYWLHRISHHAEVSYPLLEQGKLSIGFSDFATPSESGLPVDWSSFEIIIKGTWLEKARTKHNLKRFLLEMKKGDWVIVPTWGAFSIHEIIGESPKFISEVSTPALYDWSKNPITVKDLRLFNSSNQLIDLGFYWDVKTIESGISRSKFADAMLTSRMKTYNTNLGISDLEKSVKSALDSFKLNKPVNFHAEIIEKSTSIVLKEIIEKLNPSKFEELIKWYFLRIGASEVIIPSKNERDKAGDADIVATFEGIRTIICVQAKFHTKETASDWAINQIVEYKGNKDLMDDGYIRLAWVISSANSFSEDCCAYAKEQKVLLLDGRDFSKMILEAGLSNLDKL